LCKSSLKESRKKNLEAKQSIQRVRDLKIQLARLGKTKATEYLNKGRKRLPGRRLRCIYVKAGSGNKGNKNWH
jgi:hypothetical protein